MPWKACETSRYRVSLWTFLPWNPWGYFKPNHNYGSIGSIIRQPATVEPTTITMMAPWHKPRISFWNQTTRNRKNLLRTSTYLRWNEHGGLFMIFPRMFQYSKDARCLHVSKASRARAVTHSHKHRASWHCIATILGFMIRERGISSNDTYVYVHVCIYTYYIS